MNDHASFRNGHFASGDTFEDGRPLLHTLIASHVEEVGTGDAMLRDQDRLPVSLQLSEKLGRLAFESRDEFCAHGVILKWHSFARNALLGDSVRDGDRA